MAAKRWRQAGSAMRRRPLATAPVVLGLVALAAAALTAIAAGDHSTPGAGEHWAYQPLGSAAPPTVRDRQWVRNPIDRFVLARLEAAGVKPSPQADRYALIKRLSYDLLGLPPEPGEVDAFVNDTRPDAYDRLVDRLLESPHFGERWGRHWLDMARYADSDGYEKDNPRPNAWRYRDWVIDAINGDMPFDQFTIEQLAGDLLANATSMQKLATAFHRQTLTNTEGGTDQEEFRVAAVVDRVNTTGTVWLGLTVGCAQCHNHKYDRISQREFYQLFAFFNNGDESNTMVPGTAAQVAAFTRARADYEAKRKGLDEQLAAVRARLAPGFADWERDIQAALAREAASKSPIAYHTLTAQKLTAADGVKFQRQDDGSYLVTGANPAAATYTFIASTDVADITGLKVEALPDQSLGGGGPGRTPHGNFVLSELRVAVGGEGAAAGKGAAADKGAAAGQGALSAAPVKLTAARADFSQDNWAVGSAIDGNGQTGWAVSPQFGKAHEAVFTTDAPIQSHEPGGKLTLTITLAQQYGSQHTLGRFRLSAMTGHESAIELPDKVRKVLAVPPDKRSAAQAATLMAHFVSLDPQGRKLQQQHEALKKSQPKSADMTVRVIAQRSNPRDTHILQRGDFLQPGDAVQPGTLEVLPPLAPRGGDADAMPDRLDLARWLVDGRNPLTPRVAVNHLWQHLFGRGIVTTVNDFGVRGAKPTHAALLDWLASQYIQHGWSRKAMIKLIVTSATYRQSSAHRPQLAEVDPQNDLLHRQNRFRVEAEIVRDLTLAASGLLDRTVGGPSVFPPMPPDVAALSYANNFKWKTSTGGDRYRRGMYTFFKRTSPYPNLTTFDCPDSNTTNVMRTASNTPLQALVMLNNEVYVEASQAMARRVLAAAATGDRDRLAHALRLCITRPPTDAQVQRFAGLLASARQYYAGHAAEAKSLAGAAPPGVAADEAAAWAATTRIIMNLDEFITRE